MLLYVNIHIYDNIKIKKIRQSRFLIVQKVLINFFFITAALSWQYFESQVYIKALILIHHCSYSDNSFRNLYAGCSTTSQANNKIIKIYCYLTKKMYGELYGEM